MRRGTTPTHTFKLPTSVPVDTLTLIYITYQQLNRNLVEKTGDDIALDTENNKLVITLTQKDTLALKVGKVDIQIRAKAGEAALASTIHGIPVDKILKDGEI